MELPLYLEEEEDEEGLHLEELVKLIVMDCSYAYLASLVFINIVFGMCILWYCLVFLRRPI